MIITIAICSVMAASGGVIYAGIKELSLVGSDVPQVVRRKA